MQVTVPPLALVTILLCSAGLSIYMFAWASQRKRVDGAREFSLLALAIAVYSAGYSLEISHSDLPSILSAIRIEYLGLAAVSPLFLAFSWRFTQKRALPLPLRIGLVFFVAATITVMWTTSYHRLFYVDPYIRLGGPFPALAFSKGPWYVAQFIVQELCAIASAILLCANAYRSDALRRRQALTMALGGAIPIVTALAFFLGCIPWNLDPGPLSLSCAGVVFSIALFRYGLLKIVPEARELAIDSLRDGFLVVDASGRIKDANKAAIVLLGESIGNPALLIERSTREGKALGSLLDLGEGKIEFELDAPGPGKRHLHASAYPLQSGRGGSKGMVFLISDMTEPVKLFARLLDLAEKDSLTGLLNRRRFIDSGSREVEVSRRSQLCLGFVIADLDHFKEVNDRYGHAAGDLVLVAAARRIESSFRNIDIICRWGGEEFAVLMPGATTVDASRAAERARLALAAEPVIWDGVPITVTGSFGVYHLDPGESASLEECLNHADTAMYEAKARGRNRVVAAKAL
jgi:diguanylate cyclase (GGDEF)-like protein